MVASQDASGAKIRLKYDAQGNLLETTDSLGQVKRRAYNAAGELSEVVEPNGDKAKYEYDAVGRLTTAHHPGGGKSSYVYDPLGKPTRVKNPLGRETRATYDVAGRLLTTTDANGQTTTYTYDVAGRLTEKRLADGKAIKYQYDARGQLSEVDDGAFPVRYEHDLDGRVTRIEYPAIQRSLSYEYNEAGLKTKFVDSEGRKIQYEYDDLDRLIAMRIGDNQPIGFAYDAKNRLTSRVYPNGVQGTWQYDGDDQLLKLTYTDAAGKTLAGWTYQYDAAGNRAQTTDADGRIVRHRYDPAGQLLEEIVGDKEAVKYSYLAGGNRGTHEQNGKAVTYRYDEADQLLATGDETFTHDANGNVIEHKGPNGTTRYTWDAENRLVKVVLPDGKEVSYGYAPTGERIWRRDVQGMTHYVTDGTNLLAELDGDLKPKTTYLHGEAIDQPLLMTRGDKNSFFHADPLGSISALTDSKGAVSASYDYDGFGNVRVGAGEGDHFFRFTAREFDTATGLYYYRARYYDPRTGRFLSTDPVAPSLRQARTLNPYQYALNNPFRFTDPYGTWEIPKILPDPFLDRITGVPDPNIRGQFRPSLDAGPNTVLVNKTIYDAFHAKGAGPMQRADFIAVVDHEFSHHYDFETKVGNNPQLTTPAARSAAWGEWYADPVNRGNTEVKAYSQETRRLERLGGDPETIRRVRDARAREFNLREEALQRTVSPRRPDGTFSQLGEIDAVATAPRGNPAELPMPQSGWRTAGKVLGAGVLVAGIISSVENVVTSDAPGEQLKEEVAGWSGGAIAGVIGGGLVGGPFAAVLAIGGGLVGDLVGRALVHPGTPGPSPYMPIELVDTDPLASQPRGGTVGGTIEIPPLISVELQPPRTKDDWDLALGPPLLTPDELAEATSTIPSGDLTDEYRKRAQQLLGDASTYTRAEDANRILTAQERQAAEEAARQAGWSGQGLPGGSGYNGPTNEEIGRGIGVLIDLFGNGGGSSGGGTPHRGGQMGNHPKKK